MEYRTLGRTGIKVSPLCLGAMMFGQRGGVHIPDEQLKRIDELVPSGTDV